MKELYARLLLAAKSRTTWTVVATFVVNGVGAVHGHVPAQWMPVVDAVLGLLTVYFHINPSQNYTSQNG